MEIITQQYREEQLIDITVWVLGGVFQFTLMDGVDSWEYRGDNGREFGIYLFIYQPADDRTLRKVEETNTIPCAQVQRISFVRRTHRYAINYDPHAAGAQAPPAPSSPVEA